MKYQSDSVTTNDRTEIVERGILTSSVAGTAGATFTFPCVITLTDGGLLATCRVGSKKDSADETIEIYRSVDGGHTWSEENDSRADHQRYRRITW